MFKRLRNLPIQSLLTSKRVISRLPIVYQTSPILSQAPFRYFSVSEKTEHFQNLEDEIKLLDTLKSHKCQGCGVSVQCEEEERQGFIPKEKALKVLVHNRNVESSPINTTGDRLSLRAQRLLKEQGKIGEMSKGNKKKENIMLSINSIEDMEILEKENMMTKAELVGSFKNHKIKRFVCQRCHDLKHKSQISDVVKAKVTSVDPSRIFNDIFNQVRKGSTILHVLDLSDFGATISKRVFDSAKKRGCQVLIAVNKMDVMPSGLNEGRVKNWIRLRVAEYGIRIMPEHIFLISSKSGLGLEKLGVSLKKMAEKLKQNQRDLYIIGHTNAGKSSLINALIKDSNRYEKDRYKENFLAYERGLAEEGQAKDSEGIISEVKEENEVQEEGQEENIEDEIDALIAGVEEEEGGQQIEIDEEKIQLKRKTRQENEDLEDEEMFKLKPQIEDRELTVSPFHGTTLELVKIEDLHLTWKIWDTPGVPNLLHVSTFMEDQKDTTKLLHHKRVEPCKFFIRADESLWIGGLARLDFHSGQEICATVYSSNMVSLHKTTIEKSNMFYVKQYDKILTPVLKKDITKGVFKAYDVEVKCDHKGLGDIEIDIFGVGWIGFYSHEVRNAKTKFTLYLPQEVGFNIRDALMNFDDKKLPVARRHIKHHDE